MTLVIFSVGDKEYGVEMSQVREVIRVREITTLPDTPDFVEGVINLRGKVIPLVNLRKKLKVPEKEIDRINRAIVVRLNENFVGVIVDKVNEVVSIQPADIMVPDDVLKDARYLIGVGKLKDELVFIIDIMKLLTRVEKENIQEVSQKVSIQKSP